MSKNGNTSAWQDTPAGQKIQATLGEERTLAAINKLLDRLDTVEQALGLLRTTMQQAPGMVAMVADIADEAYRNADAKGVNIDERLGVALQLAEKLTAPAMVAKLDGLMTLVDQLPGLVGIAIDTVDETMHTAVANGVDPQGLVQWAGQAAQALSHTQAEPVTKVGAFGLFRALNDDDRQKALGFLMGFLKNMGQQL